MHAYGPPRARRQSWTDSASKAIGFRAALAATVACADRCAFAAPGSIQVVAQSGAAPPSGGGTFNVFEFPSLNNSGQTATSVSLSNTVNNKGLYRFGAGGGATELARLGGTPPEGNGTFSSFDFAPPALNDAGQIAFYAALANTAGGSADNAGIYRVDDMGRVAIAREGQPAPGGNGTFGNVFGQPRLNASGHVSFSA